MSFNCDRCTEDIVGNDDKYSQAWIALDNDIKVTIKIQKNGYFDSDYDRYHGDTSVGNLCKKCFMEILTKAFKKFKEELPNI